MTQESRPASEQDKFILRMPDGMRDRLKEAAAANSRSLNAEIVDRLTYTLGPAETEMGKLRGEIAELRARLARSDEAVAQAKVEAAASQSTESPLPDGLKKRVLRAAVDHGRTLYEEVVQALELAYPPPLSRAEFIADFLDPIERETDAARRKQLLAKANQVAAESWPSVKLEFRDGEAKLLSNRQRGSK